MQTVLLSAIVVFISTSIDDLVLLILFHSQATTRVQRISILVGQILGIGVLVGISLVGSYLASRMLEGWVIGLLGFIPIILGIRAMLSKEESKEEATRTGRKSLLATVTLVTIASGGDNLGIYIPWFATLDGAYLGLTMLVFLVFTLIFWSLGYLLANQSHIKTLLSRFSAVLVPVVFLLLGLIILSENGTFAKLASLF
ncbi:MAG: cadmium resistance transporter [Sphaerochaeta sp.]|uniref:cadmium resistance transporter n=1 Tax=unclassified Sphaerochaeta TaxID=2637943 RepID=UPI0025FA0AD8|nr:MULTISPECIES: cadmium resistance transporter [unclassified Sphaerochaeta]MDX9824211.1 cadmium resistance transporter [Sphaerochaeta sp.]HPE92965.1 cadmium resistance transporter [Sphaerochaeta sp.]